MSPGAAGITVHEGQDPLLELVVVPRTAEDSLSLALVTLAVGARPPVSTAMMREHLSENMVYPSRPHP